MASPRVSSVRLDALLQHAQEPVFVLSGERRFSYVNRAWEELTGFSAEAVKGLICRASAAVDDGDLAGLASSFCPPPEALDGQPSGGPTLIVHPSGERRWRRVEFWPFHGDDGSLLCLVGIVRDADATPHVPDAESQRLRSELLEVRSRLTGRYGFDTLLGRGPGHRRLLEQVRAAAATNVPVLIVGEPGTGKTHVARTIHQQGPRRQAPLIPFDCAAVSAEILEWELFGADDEQAPPRLRLPEGSTLLISEVLDLPRDLQGRLAEALDDRVRLIATTAGQPERALQAEKLRPSFFYALTTLVVHLPPLRERLDDLPLLAQHLLERANLREGRQRQGFSAEAMEVLLGYDWPGNIRELARVVEAARTQGEFDVIQAADLPAAIRGNLGSAYTPPSMPPPITPLDTLLTQLERRLIEQALQRARQNKSKAAELLDISRPRLYRRIKELNIPDEPEPADDSATVVPRTIPVDPPAPAAPSGPIAS